MTGPSSERTADAEALARLFHETYERLAPQYGYKPREETSVPWDDVPEPNRSLMIAVAGEVRDDLVARNQQLQEALAGAEHGYERLRHAATTRPVDTPDRDTYADGYTAGLIHALQMMNDAALASVRARTPQ